jgi:hypothetical protein
VAFVECMALGEIAFQCKQWTIIGAPRSPTHVIMADTLLLLQFRRKKSSAVDTRYSHTSFAYKVIKTASSACRGW